MHSHSYENEFNLRVNEISFSYEKMSTKTRFEEEAKGNSEMACCFLVSLSQCFLNNSKHFQQISMLTFVKGFVNFKNAVDYICLRFAFPQYFSASVLSQTSPNTAITG